MVWPTAHETIDSGSIDQVVLKEREKKNIWAFFTCSTLHMWMECCRSKKIYSAALKHSVPNIRTRWERWWRLMTFDTSMTFISDTKISSPAPSQGSTLMVTHSILFLVQRGHWLTDTLTVPCKDPEYNQNVCWKFILISHFKIYCHSDVVINWTEQQSINMEPLIQPVSS